MTEEQRNEGVLALMTSVASGVDGDASVPGSMLPVSVLLLPLPVLRCGCVKGARGVGKLISTELCCEGGTLASRDLLAGWAGI